MRLLMVCMRYPLAPGHSYLTTELADALVAAGHEVEVLLVDWDGAPNAKVECATSSTGVRVIRTPPRSLRRLGSLAAHASKFVLTGLSAARALKRHFELRSFDVAIAWMPATAIAPVPRLLRRAGIAHRLLFIWDFFPDHYREIGRIPVLFGHHVERLPPPRACSYRDKRPETPFSFALMPHVNMLRALTVALLTDLHERGLDKDVTVIAWGEFGRTPQINKDGGRDHWPHAMSILAAGAGVPRGYVLGATDAKGYYASDNVHSPEDFAATLYTKMGIDPTEVDEVRTAWSARSSAAARSSLDVLATTAGVESVTWTTVSVRSIGALSTSS